MQKFLNENLLSRLVIDIGNSSIKIGIFDKQSIIYTEKIPLAQENRIADVIKNYAIEVAMICSVVKEKEKIIGKIISPYVKKIFYFDGQTKLPFENMYHTPETLGKDRIAAMAGAQYLYPNENLLVIDAGTAITYDLLVENQFIGGNIAAGIDIRLKSLNYFTDKLPLVEFFDDSEIKIFGKKTSDAILSGAIMGILFEIGGYRNICQKEFGKILTIITGGSAKYFVKKIKSPIFANSNLVIIGLERILDINNEDIKEK
ncbi:MAG: type III pantothenate kinase [Marinilabiliaceae bacterium]|nr:type III pantothenate kinase [Marinilabiliaceae bacterium]